MAEQATSPLKQEESATTREEMDFDDNEAEPEPSSTPAEHDALPSKPVTKSVSFSEAAEGDAPPAKPQRPSSPQQQAENTLIEAFPTIDTKVVRAVLMASGGQMEPAFNALLGMSDPSFRAEEQAPAQPPRPVPREPMSQMQADELYARQLAEQYNAGAPRAQNRYNQREPGRRGPNQQVRGETFAEMENERNFFDDDLPEIGRNIQQGFLDTQKKVNNWFTNFKKRLDGEESDDEDLYSGSQGGGSKPPPEHYEGRQNFGSSQREQLQGIQRMAEAQQRRSADASRYDADPHELGEDEFERLELRDDEVAPGLPPRTSSRKTANPDLFKSTSTKPPQSGPVDEVEAAGEATGAKAKKWQALTAVAPHPEEDNDPFSLGDDDEEKTEDLRKEDSQRLKDAARNSVSAAGEPAQGLEETGRSGSKNLDAEELLAGKK